MSPPGARQARQSWGAQALVAAGPVLALSGSRRAGIRQGGRFAAGRRRHHDGDLRFVDRVSRALPDPVVYAQDLQWLVRDTLEPVLRPSRDQEALVLVQLADDGVASP